ncbi:hypothetical protein ACJ73_01382 [Blastomyces percursus]|uniref:DDE Tnp4 domain-containing protein n=1 Tax=Blastomyces percursus TaxID=1658174 RepID=A0A1J9QFD3_9EURO|nr:hypothetical protein ACJ73_01382 [Blastomyces percursus]
MIKQVKQRQHQISSDLHQLIRAGENLALDKEILLIENRQLQQALNQERRRRKRGRVMGLLDPSNPSLAQFFSPAKVQRAREQIAADEAIKKSEQARKEDAKLQRAILKEQKEADIMKQRMQRDAARQTAKEQKEMDKAARAAQQQVEKELRDARKAQEQKEKEERAAARLQSRLDKNKIEESKNHLPNRESRPSISQRVAKSRFQSPARVPTDPPPEGYDDITISTNLMAACSLNLPPPKISRSGRVIKPTKHLQDYLYIFISAAATAAVNTVLLAASAAGNNIQMIVSKHRCEEIEEDRSYQYRYRPPVPIMSQFEFESDALADEFIVAKFRFTKDEIRIILPYMRLEMIEWLARYQPSSEMALCIVLARLAYPHRYQDLTSIFGRSASFLASIFNDTVQHLTDRFRDLLLWDCDRLTLEKLKFYCHYIEQRGGGDSIWGYIDGTLQPITRPNVDQRMFYSGHKHRHGIKFQGNVTPDGLLS